MTNLDRYEAVVARARELGLSETDVGGLAYQVSHWWRPERHCGEAVAAWLLRRLEEMASEKHDKPQQGANT